MPWKTMPKILSVELEGVGAFQAGLKKFAADNGKNLNKIIAAAALETHQNALKSIHRGRKNERSVAGAPPKSDTGNLVENITLVNERGEITVGSRKGAPYGYWLEFGTWRMAARPWLKPAFDKMKINLERKLIRSILKDKFSGR